MSATGSVPIERCRAAAYTVPTDAPEADGSFAWRDTTVVIAHVEAGGRRGIGYTYAHPVTAAVIDGTLAAAVAGVDALAIPLAWLCMIEAVRNSGRPGIDACAIAAVDAALWDLKGKLLNLPVAALLGPVRDAVPVYGSGGFTSYSDAQLRAQLGGWAAEGIGRVKMKVGSDPAADPARVRSAREAVGPEVELFVDANGAYERTQALRLAEVFAGCDVRWFEEPVSSDDLDGLALLRARLPDGMQLAAGEYGSGIDYFQRMLRAGAVDVLQADVTRCAGISEFLRVGALAAAWHVPLSAHTAPSLHLHPCCALHGLAHIEYFHDHVRIEQLFFDGAARAVGGLLRPDWSRPGLGLELKEDVARRYAV